jgi:hypothetical protein
MTEQTAVAGDRLILPLIGSWTYRSFVNEPDVSSAFNALEFGRGELLIDKFDPGAFSGRLIFGDTYQFSLHGASSFGNPYALRFQGTGDTTDSRGQIYNYIGYLVPIWPDGVEQRTVIVGSAIRTVPHNDGKATAGFVASWIAVKREDQTG